MPFDLKSAKPIKDDEQDRSSGFDLKTAKPVVQEKEQHRGFDLKTAKPVKTRFDIDSAKPVKKVQFPQDTFSPKKIWGEMVSPIKKATKEIGKFDLGQKIANTYWDIEKKALEERSPEERKRMYGDRTVEGALKKQKAQAQKGAAFGLPALRNLTFNLLPKSEWEENVTEKHPIYGQIGESAGTLGSLVATGTAVQPAVAGKAAGIGRSASRYLPSLHRFLPSMISTGATFGTHKGINEAVKQAKEGNYDPIKLGKEILKSTGFGAALGAAGAASTLPRRMASAAGVGFGASKLEGRSNTEALLNAGIFAAFEGIMGAGRNKQLQARAIKGLENSLGKAYSIKTGRPQAEGELAARKFLNQEAAKVGGWNKILKQSNKKILKFFENTISKVQKGIKAGKFKQTSKPQQPPQPKLLPKGTQPTQPTEPLIQEAKKYKSAEEFVNFMRGSATQYRPYNPKLRATIGLGEDSARISDLGIDPELEVTIYRGVSDGNKKLKNGKIVDGDFVTTDFESAASYAGAENVISKKVKAKDLIADYASEFDKENAFAVGAEYVYSDSKNKLINYTDTQLTNIWKQAQGEMAEAKSQQKIQQADLSNEEIREMNAGIPIPESARPTNDELIKGLSKLTAVFDIEKPFVDIGAKDTGFAIKNYYTRQSVERERGGEIVKKLTRLGLSQEDYIEATYAAAQPTLFKKYSDLKRKELSPAYQTARNYFKEYQKKLQDLEVIADPWPKSLIKRLQGENLHYREAVKTARNKESLIQKMSNNQDIIDFLKKHKIQYVHLPLRVWMEDFFTQAPDKAPRILSRFFQKRETPDIRALSKALIEEGIIEPKDVDIRNIIASYSNKVGRTIALSEIFQNAKKEGLVKSLENAPEEWVSPPARLVPEFKGTKVHPAFMNYLENFLRTNDPSFKLSRPLGYIKILAFDNPFFLLGYNVEQGFWGGSFRSIKTPSNVVRAIKSIKNKDSHYWEASENGLFSKPYIPPFQDFQKEIELMKENSFVKRGLKYLTQSYRREGKFNKLLSPVTGTLDTIYRPLWYIAWNFSDKYPRMVSYHHFLRQGMTPKESAQMAAYFHGDYASLPAQTRRIANRIFFTPTFKIIMSKLQLSMMKSTGKVIANAARLKKSTKRDKVLAGGLLGLLGLEIGRRMLMKHYGFKEEDWGLRFYKEIDTPRGKKELTIYWPSAGNNWLRYYHRWKTFPQDPDKLEGFINRAKWDLHPLWRNAVMNLQNRRYDGRPIYNPFDDKADIAEDIMEYNARTLVGVLDRLPKGETETAGQKESYDALRHDLGKMFPFFQAVTPTKNVYLRELQGKYKGYRARQLYEEFRKFIYADKPKTREQKRKRIDNFKERLRFILSK